MKKIIVVLLSLSLFYLYQPLYPVYAVEPGASDSILEKINQLKSEIASKAAQIKSQISQKLENRVAAGVVSSTGDNLIIITHDRVSQNIVTNSFTTYDRDDGAGSQVSFSSVKKDQYVAGLGEIDDKNQLVAKKVVVTSNPDNLPQSFWVQVEGFSKDKLQVRAKDGNILTLNLSDKTTIYSGQDEAPVTRIQVGSIIVAVGSQKQDQIEVRTIFLVANGRPLKLVKSIESTKSATPSGNKR